MLSYRVIPGGFLRGRQKQVPIIFRQNFRWRGKFYLMLLAELARHSGRSLLLRFVRPEANEPFKCLASNVGF
jgi:hypothetical protein